MSGRRFHFYHSAPFWQALLEGSLVSGVLFYLLALAVNILNMGTAINAIALIVALGGTEAALRMRPFSGKLFKVAKNECFTAALLVGCLAVVGVLFPALTGNGNMLNALAGTISAWLLIAAAGPGFLFLRVFFYILDYWNGKRRKSLLWEMTNAFLTVALAAGGTILLTLFLYPPSKYQEFATSNLASLPGQIFEDILTRIFPITATIIVLMTFAIIVLFPIFALVSYLVARRMTGRIDRLGLAAEAMRAGDLSARVKVEGEDELARVQSAFNQMAAGLQSTTGELQTERDRLAALLRSQRELTAGVSHELRTPVATLRGYTETSLNDLDKATPEELRHNLEVIDRETQRLGRLIDDLFDLSRSEVKALSLNAQAVDAAQTIARVVETSAPLAWQSGRVQVSAQPEADLPAIRVDPARLEQILINLIQNGIRHTPPGGVVVVSAALAPGEPGWLALQVADTGHGIPAEALPHIWERFYRVPGMENGLGAGLGLALVKELSEAMGGRVGVESALGEGSRFSVAFPVFN
jgi:signal transduction histidine kinase